jgi:three-Cys-motif partner protein
MGKLIVGDDGLPAEEVGLQAKEKHDHLCSYVDISRAARGKYLGEEPGKGGATYIDLFCGAGRARVRETGEWIDGSAVAAWKKSAGGRAPFSAMHVNDSDAERLRGTVERLRSLGAPVVEYCAEAVNSAQAIIPNLNPYGLHFAFVDPWNLEALDFQIFRRLSTLRRIDILVHLSKMDLQRNLGINLSENERAFDAFAPGWRAIIDMNQAHAGIRSDLIDYWRSLIEGLHFGQPAEEKLIRGSGNQPLYWLLLIAKHELARSFWKTVSQGKQGQLRL